MKTIRNIQVLFILIIVTLLNSLPAAATHTAGANLTYTHLGGSMYKLKLTFYRDCYGIAIILPIIVNAHSNTCGIDTDYVLTQIPNTGSEISRLCPTAQSICNGGNQPGYQKWEFELDVSLYQCSDWTFTFSCCCRDGCSTVIPGTTMTVQAHLDNSISDNSSPQFLNDPVFQICSDQDFRFNHGAQDPDGDSLAYHFIDAIGATYVFPYSGQYPIESVPPATFDSITGDYLVHPVSASCGVIAYEIMEFRNGVLIGSVIREINQYSTACVNTIPTESGMNGTTQRIVYVFPDDTICFDIFSMDPDPGDTLTMAWDQSIPAATFSTAGSPFPTGTFCWTPGMNDLRSQPYMFTSSIMDNNCPMMGIEVYSFFIYVSLDSSIVLTNKEDMHLHDGISIYPNPSDGFFEIRSAEKIKQINIFDQFGRFILSVKGETFDLSSFAPGIYIAEIKTADNQSLRQYIIKK